MVRGTVTVHAITELWEAYDYFIQMDNMDGVLSIDYDFDSDLKQVTVVFSHYETLIGEVVFRHGNAPANLYS